MSKLIIYICDWADCKDQATMSIGKLDYCDLHYNDMKG